MGALWGLRKSPLAASRVILGGLCNHKIGSTLLCQSQLLNKCQRPLMPSIATSISTNIENNHLRFIGCCDSNLSSSHHSRSR